SRLRCSPKMRIRERVGQTFEALLSPAAAKKSGRLAQSARRDRRRLARWPSSVTDPRVQPSDSKVHQDVQQHENNRVKEDQVLHHKDIAFAHRGKHRIAKARCPKGALYRDRSGKDKSEENAG